jgi:nucleotide-binding universal stress UspA family protein
MAIYLAYDGSVNGDWIARYAVNFAAGAGGVLNVLHVETTDISGAALAEKLEGLRRLAELAGVRADVEILPMRGGVYGGLKERLPRSGDAVVVCGLRARGGRRGYLKGTISERLLDDQHFLTVALRVVQPGLLGAVQRLMMPVAGHRPGISAAHRLLGLLAPSLAELHLLHVVQVGALRFRRLDMEDAGALRHGAQGYLDEVERDIVAGQDLSRLRVDAAVRVSDDWVREVLLDAGRMRADLIALEAPRASLASGQAFGDPLEVVFRETPCDVAIYRGPVEQGRS